MKDNKVTIIISALAVVAALAVAAFAISASGNDEDEGTAANVLEWQTVNVTGDPLPPASDQNNTPNEAVGAQAPSLDGKTFTGEAVSIKADGRKKVVMFWAHWCPHCQADLPKIAPWLERNRQNFDVDFYSVATGTNPTRPNFPPSEWFEDENYPSGLTIMADSRANAAGTAFGLSSYPYVVALDGQNKVVTRSSGELGAEGFESLVRRLVAAP